MNLEERQKLREQIEAASEYVGKYDWFLLATARDVTPKLLDEIDRLEAENAELDRMNGVLWNCEKQLLDINELIEMEGGTRSTTIGGIYGALADLLAGLNKAKCHENALD